MNQLNHISTTKNPKRVLFLGAKANPLIELFISKGYLVFHTTEIIHGTNSFALVIIYRYSHELGQKIIDQAICPIIDIDGNSDLPKEILIWDKYIRQGFENFKALQALNALKNSWKQ